MNTNQIDITVLLSPKNDNFVPFDLSNNRATLGQDAGKLTWEASKEAAQEICLLDTEEKREEFRSFVKNSGGWTMDEIEKWDSLKLNAMFLQWVAGDIREAFGDEEFENWDWKQYEKDCHLGICHSSLFKTEDEKVYFDMN